MRLELHQAGSPSFVVATVSPGGRLSLYPLTFAARGPAARQARTVAGSRAAGDEVVVVSREETSGRAVFTVYDETMRILHKQMEVIEASLLEEGIVATGTV